jgi:hypothetical protein
MTVGDRAVFESVAGRLLETLGYELEGHARRVSGPEQLYWTLHHRFWWTMRRLQLRDATPWLRTELQLRLARGLAQRSEE